MRNASGKSIVLDKQKEWARRHAKTIDSRGYVESMEVNLFQPLSSVALMGFNNGSGSELIDAITRPAKIRALHSSAALAVNVFDYWTTRDAAPLARALREPGEHGAIEEMAFERQYPTGLGGNPPNLDIALRFASGLTVAIESKFTEWMTPKAMCGEVFRPAYFPAADPIWRSRGLHRCQHLAEALQAGTEGFRWLDVPQLLKHALGLASAVPGQFSLHYIYFDHPGPEGAVHRAEIARFSTLAGDEIRFAPRSYQDLFCMLVPHISEQDRHYAAYLQDRYFSR